MPDSPLTVVLLSGGIDSITLAAATLAAGNLAACVHVIYGAPNGGLEYRCASDWCRAHGVPLHTIEARIPCEMSGDPGDPCVVPGRNLVLLALAASVAASVGASRVALGATQDDQADYLDCRPYFAGAMTAALECAGLNVEYVYPYAGISKGAVVEIARRHGVDLGATFSCYTPNGSDACGQCASCAERSRVLGEVA